MTTAKSALKGQSLMTMDIFRSGDTWEQAKFMFEIVEAMVKRPFIEEEAKRLFDFLFWSSYDFQSCELLRNLFVLKNQGDLDHKWIDYLCDRKIGKKDVITLLSVLGNRVVKALSKLGEIPDKDIVNEALTSKEDGDETK